MPLAFLILIGILLFRPHRHHGRETAGLVEAKGGEGSGSKCPEGGTAKNVTTKNRGMSVTVDPMNIRVP